MRLPTNSLVLVADGRKMLLLRQTGTPNAPELTLIHGEDQPNPADHDQKTDAAGRMPQGGTPGQSSTSETDFHQQTEDVFARSVAEHLNAMALQNELGDLVVVAAPRTLGQLRKHFNKQVEDKIVGEIGKVMTGYSTDRIAAMLSEVELAA